MTVLIFYLVASDTSILLLLVNDIQKTKTGKSQSYYIIIINLMNIFNEEILTI